MAANPPTRPSITSSTAAGRSIDDFPIVQRFNNWSRRTSLQGDCRCPVHDDGKASLSVGLTNDGDLGLTCHAGCNTGDILRAVGGCWSDLFYLAAVVGERSRNRKQSHSAGSGNQKGRGSQKKQSGDPWTQSKIVDLYDYCTVDGTFIFQVVRFDPKDFRQRHKVANGQWIRRGVPPEKRVLWNLPAIAAAAIANPGSPGQPVFLCEGEKDAKRLIASGLLATTAAGGASSDHSKNKWLPQYTESLRGRVVVIVPDCDPPDPKTGKIPGRDHANHVAKSLSGPGGAAHVAILELPLPPAGPPVVPGKAINPQKKWDISDWLDAGGSREQFDQAVAVALGAPFDPASTSDTDLPKEICNADDDPITGLTPLKINEIIKRIKEQTGDWPRRVGSALFVDRTEVFRESDQDVQSDNTESTNGKSEPSQLTHSLHWLERTSQLYAFIGAKTHSPPVFHRLPGAHTKEEVFAGLQQSSTIYQAVEILPHEPPIPGHYYACDVPEPGTGEHLLSLVQRFSPATPIDCDLILCLFATLLWGGSGGSRPAFVITSDDGRGVGKSKMAGMVSHLAGGVIEISANEDSAKMKERLLSPEGLTKRVALLDNVKTLRFSWAELESLITSPVVSGKRLYVGEASRPNNLTWIITLNGVSLSTDMAQRSVVVKIKRPSHSGDWEEEIRQFIDRYRQEIIADLIGFLRGPRTPLIRFTRWGSWERSILSLTDDPDSVQQEIIARQESSDVEEEDAGLIVEFFRQKLQELSYQPDHDKVHIPSSIAAKWLCEATNERHGVSAASRMLKQKCTEGTIKDLQINKCKIWGRGFIWFPAQAIGEVQLNLQQRIDNPTIGMF
jgi:hypothetical protein